MSSLAPTERRSFSTCRVPKDSFLGEGPRTLYGQSSGFGINPSHIDRCLNYHDLGPKSSRINTLHGSAFVQLSNEFQVHVHVSREITTIDHPQLLTIHTSIMIRRPWSGPCILRCGFLYPCVEPLSDGDSGASQSRKSRCAVTWCVACCVT